MPQFGTFVMGFSLVVILYVIVMSYYGGLCKDLDRKLVMVQAAQRGLYAYAVLLWIASGLLLYLIVIHDFRVEYIWSYTSRDLPTWYLVTAFWAGQKGSLLFWGWLLATYSGFVAFNHRKELDMEIVPWVFFILGLSMLFFSVLLFFATDPFELFTRGQIASIIANNNGVFDGNGLNPLLQNPGMIWHPPTLFMGYVGFTIPMAYGFASLITGDVDDFWIKITRKWSVWAWLFLSIGILLGCEWAYVELGWGGYWAWDPVENASLIPWFTGSAFVHSVMIQERRDMLKVWNIALVLLTYELCIFGTFITRSGLIASVHAFGQSVLGYYFLAFMIVTSIIGAGMIYYRRKLLTSENELESVFSKESAFLLNNLILVAMAIITIWGTIFPKVREAMTGTRITIGPPFFNDMNVPLGMLLMLLMGICPLIAWKKATPKNFEKNFIFPGTVLVFSAIALVVAGIREPWAVAGFSISFFVLSTILMEFFRGVAARCRSTGENVFVSFYRLVGKNKRRYGGYIIHLGLVMIFIGITGSSVYSLEEQATLAPGESTQIKDYTVKFIGLNTYPTQNKDVVVANFDIYKGGKLIDKLAPGKYFYYKAEQPSTEVAVRSGFREDLYMTLGGYDSEKRLASIRVKVNPLVLWMWIGGFVFTFGTIVALWPDKRRAITG